MVAQAQKQKTYSRVVILDVQINGRDATESYTDRKQFLTLYQNESGNFCFANVSTTTDAQSFGQIYDFKSDQKKETTTTYEGIDLDFRWRYANTYDKKRGTALVNVVVIKKPQGSMFICTIIPEDLEIMTYKGYVQGTLDFSGVR